jgi:ribosomal subunit interface protein
MQLTVTGKQVDVGNALRQHVESTLESILGKYFRSAIEAHAVFARDAHRIRADLSLHIGRGIVANSGAAASDHYQAFDAAAERLAKQLRRYKRRLRIITARRDRPANGPRWRLPTCSLPSTRRWMRALRWMPRLWPPW